MEHAQRARSEGRTFLPCPGEQEYRQQRKSELLELAASHGERKCWWRGCIEDEELHDEWYGIVNHRAMSRLERGGLSKEDFLEGLRLLLRKRPEILALFVIPGEYDGRQAQWWWERGVLGGMLDVVEDVYGPSFTSYLLNRLLDLVWSRVFPRGWQHDDAVYPALKLLLHHPLADLSVPHVDEQSPHASLQKSVIEVRAHPYRQAPLLMPHVMRGCGLPTVLDALAL